MIDDTSSKKIVRVRFAPSPTGFFHIGSARTALFNWLFAKQHHGKFILRIEDTDIERSNSLYEKDIIESLKWLGLDWDEGPQTQISENKTEINANDTHIINVDIQGNNLRESTSNQRESAYKGDYGPYRQSERLDIYEKYLQRLLDENKAYYCFCSKEQVDEDKKAMLAQGLAPKYSARCRHLSKEEAENKIKKGEASIIRFKVPETEIEFNDFIRGKIKFNVGLLGDIVIAKSLRCPLFNFSGAIDDYEMKITHIIRGEDHISNTPKQILIQKALNFDEPKYAHLPMILSSDRSKMSKRSLETNLIDYKKQGILPETIVNFSALLGWHPKNDKEFFSLEELVQEFDLKRVQKSGAIFDTNKLEWLNSQYIKKIDPVELAKKIKEFIPSKWESEENKELLIKIVSVERERMKTLADFKELTAFFFELPDYALELLIWPRPKNEEKIIKEKTLANLKLLTEEIEKIFKVDFNKINLERIIMPLTEIWGRGELLWPLRASLSGKETSPGPFEIMEILGKEETLKRINIAIQKLS